MMLHDEHLVGAAVEYIRDDKINAEWGLRRAVDDIRAVFDSIEDPYLKERKSDVEFVFDRVLRNLLGRVTGPLMPPPDAVVVAYDLSPADTAQLHKAAVSGLITDAGGKTSHTAIIARASRNSERRRARGHHERCRDRRLSRDRRLDRRRDRQSLGSETVAEYRDEQRRQVAANAHLHAMRDLPARTRDDVDIQLLANIDGPEELDSALDYGALGVGLFRTEYLYMTGLDLPDEEAQLPDDGCACSTSSPAGPRRSAPTTSVADKLAKFIEAADLHEANPGARPALDPAVPVEPRQGSVQEPAARPVARVGARPDQADVFR